MTIFLKDALPFVIIAFCLAVIAAHHKRKAEGRGAADQERKNYMQEGMCLGMCLGTCAASVLHIHFGLGDCLWNADWGSPWFFDSETKIKNDAIQAHH